MTLTQAMRTLTPAQREILVETYVEGHTVAEAARRLGVPLGTAKSQDLLRARGPAQRPSTREV